MLLIIVTPVPATPFTVVVSVLVLEVFETELTRGTAVPAMPFTEVVNVFADELLETSVTLLLVAGIPFTVLVIVFPDMAKVFVVVGISPERSIPALATPLTVVVNVLPVKLLEMLFTAGAVTDTPFTIEVMVLAVLLNVCVVEAEESVVGAQAVPFQPKTCPLVAPVTVPNGDPFILATTVAPKFPVTSPAVAAVNAELATPLMVLINWFDPFWVRVWLLIKFTPVPTTPFTVVVNVFTELLLLTLFTAAAVTETPFTTDVRVLMALLSVCVVVAGAVVVGAQAVPFHPNTWPVVAPVMVPNGDPFNLETTVAPKFPVTSPAVAAVNTELATPLMVLIN